MKPKDQWNFGPIPQSSLAQTELSEACETFLAAKRARTLALPPGGPALLEAEEQLARAGRALQYLLARTRRYNHAGWRYFLDREGRPHCVRIPPRYLESQIELRPAARHRRRS